MLMPVFYPAKETVKTDPDAPFLAICLPVRKTSPVEFWVAFYRMIHPLNVRMGYLIQKGADTIRTDPDGTVHRGSLPAESRNKLLKGALELGASYALFFDDDIIAPDVTMYRLWITAQKHPEAGVITGVATTKIEPCEPMLYQDSGSGAYWDWPLGALTPIHSSHAGCMIVNLDYVRRLEPPWFDDQVSTRPTEDGVSKRRNIWGQDRYFMNRLREEAGAQIYADTGLLVAHWDTETQTYYTLPADAPCFQRPPVGESFIPIEHGGNLTWRRVIAPSDNSSFLGYLDWLNQSDHPAQTTVSLVEETNNAR